MRSMSIAPEEKQSSPIREAISTIDDLNKFVELVMNVDVLLMY